MNQSEYFGKGCIDNLSKILSDLSSVNIFLVRGKKSYTLSGAEEILNELLKNYSVTYFNEFTESPKIEEVIKGMDSLIETECDIVIAVGGGSVIDIAKSVNILSSQEERPESIITGRSKIINKGKPLIAIPTTSGSGSEATHFAVVYIGKQKYSLAHEFILPDYAITDPQLTFNLPPDITAASGIDAFAQAIESYWNVNANEESKKYSAEAVTLILDNLIRTVNTPDEESRISMSKAAHLAGKAINITKTTASHALSYSMTTNFGTVHGQAVGITLGEFLEYNYNVSGKDLNGRKSLSEVKNNMDELLKLLGCKNVTEGKTIIKELMLKTGLKTKLPELNIKTEDDLKLIINEVNLERLQNNPRKVTVEGLEEILRNIL
ncbi:MAG: phosphonoacetaldehyde reductase [Ignavibacteria bacterium]|nr:phosphonoacetaldehyde reductase [Ignavibacteria bacterium]